MEILKNFKEKLIENEKSKNTIESYIRDVKQFLFWNNEAVNNIDKSLIKEYTKYLQDKNLTIKTVNRKLVSVNQFIEFLNDEEVLPAPIIVKVKQLKVENQNFIDDMLDNNDVIRIINASNKNNDIRATTLFYTMFYTGARVSEVLQIKATDINKDSITIKGKGNKYRELLIPKKLKVQWLKYMEVRNNTSEYLFTGTRGAINRQTVHNLIKLYTGKARGINKSIAHAHAFRHLYAQNLATLGVAPVVISQLLGHTLNITGLYMQISKKDLLKVINQLDLEPKKNKKKK